MRLRVCLFPLVRSRPLRAHHPIPHARLAHIRSPAPRPAPRVRPAPSPQRRDSLPARRARPAPAKEHPVSERQAPTHACPSATGLRCLTHVSTWVFFVVLCRPSQLCVVCRRHIRSRHGQLCVHSLLGRVLRLGDRPVVLPAVLGWQLRRFGSAVGVYTLPTRHIRIGDAGDDLLGVRRRQQCELHRLVGLRLVRLGQVRLCSDWQRRRHPVHRLLRRQQPAADRPSDLRVMLGWPIPVEHGRHSVPAVHIGSRHQRDRIRAVRHVQRRSARK